VRVIMDEKGEPWWVAKDVCDVLGYSKEVSAVVQMHCKRMKVFKPPVSGGLNFGPRGVLIIPEADLYRLIIRSKLPDAERFEVFIMEQVIPKYRKGLLVDVSKKLPQTYGDALLEAGRLQKELEASEIAQGC